VAIIIAAIAQAVDVAQRMIGLDVLVSLAGLAAIILFLYVEGGSRSRPSH